MKTQKLMYAVALTIAIYLMSMVQASASSHREAPLIANDPLADNVDLYAFRSPDNPNFITIIATYVPLQMPHGGPNYHGFGENIRYEIHVDNDASKPGDEVTYRFTFRKVNEDPSTFFNIRLGKQNLKTTYTMERSLDNGATWVVIVSNGVVPPNNIGPRSIDGPAGMNAPYASLFNSAITNASTGERVFAGSSDDPFFVDLGGIFDLGDSPRQVGKSVDGLACLNVSTIAIQIPIATLLKAGASATPTSILDPNYVIGVWASASRKAITTLSKEGDPSFDGDWVQVSRLGMPLTNEAVIPIGKKDFWNRLTPYDEIAETTLDEYFYNPELALYMDDALFGGAVPALSPLRIQKKALGAFNFGNGGDGLYGLKGNPALAGTALDDAVFGTLLLPAAGKPRSVDLWPAFHTGVPNVVPYQLATGKNGNPLAVGKPFVHNFLPNGGDMLRLNMAVPPTPRDDPQFSSLGLVQAAVLGLTAAPYNTSTNLEFIPNMDGFPNGRRLEDDVTRIELQAVAGVVLAAVGLWYDDFDPNTSTSPVTKQLLNVVTYTTGVEKNDKKFGTTFPYVAMPHSGYGECSGRPDLVGDDGGNITPDGKVFTSSNISRSIGFYGVNAQKQLQGTSFIGQATDADGVFYDDKNDILIQLNRATNKLDAYGDVARSLANNSAPKYLFSSTSDFTNGREITVAGDRVVVAQDANTGNNNENKLIVYKMTSTGFELKNVFNTSINLWGIQADLNTLYAIVDNSNKLAVFNDFFLNTGATVEPSTTITVDGIVRTHGLAYDHERDIMVLTDIGDANSGNDGALVVINNYMTAAADASIKASEQIRIAGDQSLLGNPVDVAIDGEQKSIYVAERAGGKLLVFAMPDNNGNIAPFAQIANPGISAVYLVGSTREGQPPTATIEVKDGSLLELNIFPNPTSNFVNIKWKGDEQNFKNSQVEIYDVTGKLIQKMEHKEGTQFTTDISNYVNGAYLVKVFNSNYEYQTKLIKF
jgi:hypothetical protein